MNIRNMTIDDYDAAYGIWLLSPEIGLNNIDDTKENIAKYLERNPNTCFVAEEGGNVAGVILCGHDGRRGFVHHTAVAREMRRRGIGSALVKAAMESLGREGVSKAYLLAFTVNAAGNAFWEKQGFVVRDELVFRTKVITETVRTNA